MRKLVAAWMLGLWTIGLASQAFALDDSEMPPGIEKITRGAVNVIGGFPEELVVHTTGAVVEYGEDSLGGWVASILGGVVLGTFWGVARVGSGIVDVFTFPVPFNDNRPLLEPDHDL